MKKELVTKMADDIWAIAKTLESDKHEQSEQLKRISSCLHDIRAERESEWYFNWSV